MDQKEWEARKALVNELHALRTEMGWHRFYVENFFAWRAVAKYPDEGRRELRMWEYHERKSIRGYNQFRFETLGVANEELKAHRNYFTHHRETFKDGAWSMALSAVLSPLCPVWLIDWTTSPASPLASVAAARGFRSPPTSRRDRPAPAPRRSARRSWRCGWCRRGRRSYRRDPRVRSRNQLATTGADARIRGRLRRAGRFRPRA